MDNWLKTYAQWTESGARVAVATVVKTWGSSPRAPGAKMLVRENGDIYGSVSAGCVEGAVIEEGLAVLKTEEAKLLQYGVSDDTAWDVGLACGGQIEVLVEPSPTLGAGKVKLFRRMSELLQDRQSCVWMHLLDNLVPDTGRDLLLDEEGATLGSLPGDIQTQVVQEAGELLKVGSSQVRTYQGESGPHKIFFEVHRPGPTLILVGGVHISVALAPLAKQLGYRVFVVDPRTAFATESRFPDADGLVLEWPDEGLRQVGLNSSTAVAVLTHDPKLDDPALMVALVSRAFYVGALGSKRTQKLRRERLTKAGIPAETLARLYGPIGLDLGARSPEEIALSILSEIVAVRSGSMIVA
jgi:xanthine dehydrogenase accessory factor